MDDSARDQSLIDLFGKLSPEVLGELSSILRLYSIDAQELFFKWESYCMRMGNGETQVTLETAREFKKDVQERMEKEMKAKVKMQSSNDKTAHAPRFTGSRNTAAGSSDVFGLLDRLTSTRATNTGGVKRKVPDRNLQETPKKTSRFTGTDSPGGAFNSSPLPIRTSIKSTSGHNTPETPFSQRTSAGTTLETLNALIPKPELPLPEYRGYELRVTLAVNTEVKKFSYRPMYQTISEAAQFLDDKIEELITMLEDNLQISQEEIRDPSALSTSQIVGIGRIASDASEGKINSASVILESCRCIGAGSRVPLKLDQVPSYSFFPGQIVAVRGVNPGGKYFAVKEILEPPSLPPATTSASSLQESSARLSSGPLNVFIASGPYTTDDNLLFEPLLEICKQAAEKRPDILILMGPFIDLEHPLIASGDFELEEPGAALEGGTLEDLFRERITQKIKQVRDSMIILLPSIRDAVSKHVCYPQEPLSKKSLELPKNVRCLPNPSLFSLNEILFGASTNDILFHLSREEIHKHHPEHHPFTRACKHIIEQRNFYPLFPPPSKEQLPEGAGTPNIDVPYMKLADFSSTTPDVLLLPSQLPASAKVVDSVVAINPGFLSKKQGSGTFATMTILPRTLSAKEEDDLHIKSEDNPENRFTHKVYERARVDVLRI